MYLRKGEVREVGIEVFNELGQDFEIETAEYEVVDTQERTIDKGYADIKGHRILALFSAQERGRFYMVFTYRIGPEILKAKIFLEVKK